MPAIDYSEIAASALEMLTDFGASYTLSQAQDTLDPVTGAVTEGTALSGTVKAVLLPYPSNNPNRLNERFNEQLIRGEIKQILIAASGAPFKPKAGYTITIGSDVWKLLGCDPLEPDGSTALLYSCGAIRV